MQAILEGLSRRKRAAGAGLLAGLLLLLGSNSGLAHRVSSVSLLANLDSKARTYRLDVAMEVIPSEDPSVNEQVSPEDAAREFAGYLGVLFDEAEQKPAMEVSLEENSDSETPPELRRQQVVTRLSGTIPEGAKDFLLYLDPRCPMAVVMVAVKDGELGQGRMQVILSGEYSRPIPVGRVEEGDPFSPGAKPAPASSDPATADADRGTRGATPAGVPTASHPGPFLAGARAFFAESLLPSFLAVGILLLTLGRTRVLWQGGCLLAATGLTSALAAFGLVAAPTWSETALALLTTGLVLEALLHRHVRAWRYPLVAVAGIFLGLFLAGTGAQRTALGSGEIDLGEIVLFLLGTQAAMALLVLAAAAVLLPLSRSQGYRKTVVTPLAVLLGGACLFLAVERFL